MIRKLFRKQKTLSRELKKPNHIALNLAGNLRWSKNHKKTPEEGHSKGFEKIMDAVQWQVGKNIPIMSVYLMPETMKDTLHLTPFLDSLVDFFKTLYDHEFIHKNKIKISVLGKWYDLPGRAVDPIKSALDATKDYDQFFLNFCINYNGQTEIVDACKLLIRKIQSGRLELEELDASHIKENIYASYFTPPDLFVVFLRKSLQGHLLWDCSKSVIYFSDKLWPNATPSDLDKAVDYYNKVQA